ncbi:MAG: LCP family protein, partial [Chloroflexaceae bacterium]|nr:LCP family protein [Chloroflexaceae bacterium]
PMHAATRRLLPPLIGGTNILIVGVDERPDHPEEGVRSDTLMLVRLDAATGRAALLSIPRDTQVDVVDIGTTKINVAYGQGYALAEQYFGPGTTPQQGGMALATQTTEHFLGLSSRGMRIDYTMQINFDGFVSVIDALGGITIDVPVHIIDDAYPTEDFGYMRVEFFPGPQQMDGQTALIYARTRHADSDFGRAERQQQVVRAIAAELQSRGWAGRLAAMPALLESVAAEEGQPTPFMTTLPIDRPDVLFGMALLGARLDPNEIQQLRITPETVPLVAEIGSNLVWDPAGVDQLVDQFFRGPPPAGE